MFENLNPTGKTTAVLEIAIMLIVAYLLGIFTWWLYQRAKIKKKEQEIEDLQSKLKQTVNELEAVNKQLAECKSKASKLEGTIKTKEAESKKKIDELLLKQKELEEKYKALQVKYDKLSNENSTIIAEKEKLAEEHKLLKENHDKLIKAHNSTVSEKNKLSEEFSELRSNVDKLKNDNNTIVAEKNKLIEEYNVLKNDYNNVVEQKKQSASENENLKNQNIALKVKADSAETYKLEIEKCQDENNQLMVQLSELKTKNTRLSDEVKNFSSKEEAAKKLGFRLAKEEEKEDLTIISGIGKFIESKLNNLGIYTIAQISEFSAETIDKVTEAIEFFPGRIKRDFWVEQAKQIIKDRRKKDN